MIADTRSASVMSPLFVTADETNKASLARRLIGWLTAGEQPETYSVTSRTNPDTFSIEFERRLLGQ